PEAVPAWGSKRKKGRRLWQPSNEPETRRQFATMVRNVANEITWVKHKIHLCRVHVWLLALCNLAGDFLGGTTHPAVGRNLGDVELRRDLPPRHGKGAHPDQVPLLLGKPYHPQQTGNHGVYFRGRRAGSIQPHGLVSAPSLYRLGELFGLFPEGGRPCRAYL